MPKKKKELKIRAEAQIVARFDWIKYCRREADSGNDCLVEALTEWVERMEKTYGKQPPTARPQLAPKSKVV